MTVTAPFLTVELASERGTFTLSQSSYKGAKLLDGVRGLGVGPVENTTTPVTNGHGSILQNSRLGEAEIMLPIALNDDSPSDLALLRRELERVVAPGLGVPVEVHAVAPGLSTHRSRTAYYSSGLEGELGGSASHFTWNHLNVYFTCPDPLWYGQWRDLSWSLNRIAKPLITDRLIPFFPIFIAPSVVQGRQEFTVSGDAPTFPVWEFHGAGTDLLIECGNCGQRVFIEGEVPQGLIIDTRPEVEDIYAPGWDPAELWNKVSDDSALFNLTPGSQEVAMSVVGANASTELRMRYRESWMAGF